MTWVISTIYSLSIVIFIPVENVASPEHQHNIRETKWAHLIPHNSQTLRQILHAYEKDDASRHRRPKSHRAVGIPERNHSVDA